MSTRLIALIAIAVMVDGVRTMIQPGQELPEMSDADAKALLQSGAAQDRAAIAARAKADDGVMAKTQADFDVARAAVHARTLAAKAAVPKATKPAAK